MTGSDERRSDAVAFTATDDRINDFVSFVETLIKTTQLSHYVMIMIIDFIAMNLKANIDKLEPDHRGPAAVISAHLAPMLSGCLTSGHPEEMWPLLLEVDLRLRRSHAQLENDRLFL